MNDNNATVFFKMKNVIQHYPWGSTTSFTELFGYKNPMNQPQAEMWMGTHPNGCSKIVANEEMYLLSDFINLNRTGILSEGTAAKFSGLPYLLKVLAADKPLSIQVHPSKIQAKEGFEKEDRMSIPRKAANRNYKDQNHKPELVYALTPYQAMNGFRKYSIILSLFRKVGVSAIENLVFALEESANADGLETFFRSILSLDETVKKKAIKELLTYAENNKHDELFALIIELSEQYPGDVGLFCPLMLNVLTLQPREAMYLDACTPHAYLKGTALEIMANSDNVLRSALTPKHIDIEEVVRCTHFEEKSQNALLTQPKENDGGLLFSVPVDDFNFAIFESVNNLSLSTQSAEILFAIDSCMTLTHENGEIITVNKGESVFIPAYTNEYLLSSEGRVARAYN